MDAGDVISLGALGVAALSVLYGPRVAGSIAAKQQITNARLEVYGEAISLMRARLFYVEDLAGLTQDPYTGPSDSEGDATAARLLLMASEPVWRAFTRFFSQYNATGLQREAVELARRGGQPNLEGRAALKEPAERLKRLVDLTVDAMAQEVGTRRLPLTT